MHHFSAAFITASHCPILILQGLMALFLGGAASAQLQFSELEEGWLPPDEEETVCLATGDVDGDGDLDFVAGNLDRNRMYLNDGFGVFTEAALLHVPGSGAQVVLEDLDGDGDLDLVTCGGLQDLLFLNDGSGGFVDRTSTHMPEGRSRVVDIGDVDGDGDLDLVFPMRLCLNLGGAVFQDATTTHMPPPFSDRPTSIALGDVDGDGDLDLLVGTNAWGPFSAQNRLYENDGAGRFTDVTSVSLPLVPDKTTALALGDLDGDGDLDLMTTQFNFSGFAEVQLLLNDGAGVFLLQEVFEAAAPIGVVLADVDSDGDLDAVVAQSGSYNPTGMNAIPRKELVLINDGVGGLTLEWERTIDTAYVPGEYPYTLSVALVDLDRDGDLDMLLGNGWGAQINPVSNQNGVHLNLLRQLHAPAAPHVGEAYELEAYARHAPAGTQAAVVPYFSTGLEPSASPYGTFWLDRSRVFGLPLVPIPDADGVVSFALEVPDQPGLAGVPLHAQGLILRDPVDARWSNVVSDVVQP